MRLQSIIFRNQTSLLLSNSKSSDITEKVALNLEVSARNTESPEEAGLLEFARKGNYEQGSQLLFSGVPFLPPLQACVYFSICTKCLTDFYLVFSDGKIILETNYSINTSKSLLRELTEDKAGWLPASLRTATVRS